MENLTFKVGDSAVYPSHGVGIIQRIEEKVISGNKKSFYVLQVVENGMTIMVPTDNTAGVGLRALVSKDEVDEVYGILRNKRVKIDRTTWNRRYREYMEKIKTGSVHEIAEVLRNLYLLKNSKDLSFGEKKMFDTAKNLLVKEISMSNDISEAEVEEAVTKALGSA
ncbi:MAG: CarD family transcriptional regulator [Oligoflexia bacterium]|nr:CarD family transcriptional regulator [Oligoflexia bacterium]